MNHFTNYGLVQYCLDRLEYANCYMKDTCGQYITTLLIETKSIKNKDKWYTDERINKLKAIADRNVRAWDDIGIIKSYRFNDYTQSATRGYNSKYDMSILEIFEAATEKGTIDTMPDVPGLAVWMDNHIGVYIGHNEVIEVADDIDPNVVGAIYKRKLSDRKWTHWLRIPFINYNDTAISRNRPGEWVKEKKKLFEKSKGRLQYIFTDNNKNEHPSNEWYKINTNWYRFDKDGYMLTGWFRDKENSKWYYLSENKDTLGVMQKSKLIQKDGNIYYLMSDGTLMVNNTITFDLSADIDGVISIL